MEETTQKEKPKDQAVREYLSDVLNEGDPKDHKVIIVREGDAPKQLDAVKPNKVHLTGAIGSPAEFYAKRVTAPHGDKKLHDKNKIHVVYSLEDGRLTLVVDENFDTENYRITGKIELNPNLLKFLVNKGSAGLRTIKEAREFLKFNRMFFADKNKCAEIVATLTNFKARAERAYQLDDDNRGNSTSSEVTKLETELQSSFRLKLPIFKGQGDEEFDVNIFCSVDEESGVNIYFESIELEELIEERRKSILGAELDKFKEVVCIQQ